MMEYQSRDPNFSVSWLIGIRPYPTRPSWAHLYETDELHFRVSRVIGLWPSRKPRRSEMKVEETTTETEPSESEEVEEEPDFGLRRLFRTGTDEDDDLEDEAEESTDTETTSSETGDPPVLAESGFLELCKDYEILLGEIE